MDSIRQSLFEHYHQALASLPAHWLDPGHRRPPEFARLCGLFLPGTSSDYLEASTRVMVVGRETRSWNIVTATEPYKGLDDYIDRAMDKQQRQLRAFLDAGADKGESFFNFIRALASQHEPGAIAWANLFCFAWNKGSPMRWKHFAQMLKLSRRLLEAQISILQPQIIIFANGASSAQYRRRFFPHKGPTRVCSDLGDYRQQGIPLSQLWRFRLHDTIQCYRIQHPSSISTASRNARKFLLEQLKRQPAG